MQQYGRALIVGSQTYGKGTIQQFFTLGNDRRGQSYGEVKLTIGNFYAGKGYATQYRGVMPDISLPGENKYLPTGERKVKNALQFSHLPEYTESRDTSFLKASAGKAYRQEKNEYFKVVEKIALERKRREENTLPRLDDKAYKAQERDSIAIQNRWRPASPWHGKKTPPQG
ncbi:MAG: hypothetical protein H6573_23425 [Lewinellaceae bacterium]|nr:hypothetical protein [Lewinellaceae bacterium]